jgi:4-hydroxy 2-oxovalerate aldolase
VNAKILDCTLRDGGYINNFEFGKNTIKAIISKLSNACIDIIECGFLSDIVFDENKSVFSETSQLKQFVSPKKKEIIYVAMIALGKNEIPHQQITTCDGRSIDGIRVTFHEHEIEKAIEFGSELKNKGYLVFMQPVGTTSYSDESLLKLIQKVNALNPYTFYIVDTLGTMYENDLLRLFYLVNNNLNDTINIGFHSHNNLQLSFSNAQVLLKLHTKRTILIDSSVFGMGRGAGNLCTELLTQYVNDNIGQKYNVIPLLEIVDEYLAPIFTKYTWGYSVPYYLAAINNCHPNYASHLLNKQTITVKQINRLLNQIPLSERVLYNQSLIENIYVSFQAHSIDDSKALSAIKIMIDNKEILILGPGKSIETNKNDIYKFLNEHDPFIISVNFIPKEYKCNAAFFSNIKRYNNVFNSEMGIIDIPHVILTSNITDCQDDTAFKINYESLLNDSEEVGDNAGLMLIKMLHGLDIKKIFLAGFDGFSENRNDNFYQDQLINSAEIAELISKSKAIKEALRRYSDKITIQFITASNYIDEEARTK